MDKSGDLRSDNLGYFSWWAARRRPEANALIDLSRAEPIEVSYGRLEERLDRFARLTTQLGLAPGDRLAMSVGNRYEFIEIMYGAMRAGVVPVPLNTRLGDDTLAYILKDAGCAGAAVEPEANRAFVGVTERAGLKVRLALGEVPAGWLDYERELQATPAAFDPPRLTGDHPSFQPYTSGSTGRPKGVVLTHAGQMWWIRACHRYWPHAESEGQLSCPPEIG